MTVHNKLIINSHLKDIFIVVCKNLSALTRLSTYLEINQKKKKKKIAVEFEVLNSVTVLQSVCSF